MLCPIFFFGIVQYFSLKDSSMYLIRMYDVRMHAFGLFFTQRVLENTTGPEKTLGPRLRYTLTLDM